MPVHRSRRPAFTLVELIVVIAIIALLAALTAAFFPNFQDTELVTAARTSQNWLLSAKMQAKRDGLPTGLRLNLSNITVNGTTVPGVATVDYIQQPSNFAQGVFVGSDTDLNPNAGTLNFPRAKFNLPGGMAFWDGSAGYTVQPGDYLELYGGGVLHQIARVPQPPTDMPPFLPPTTSSANPPTPSGNASLILTASTAPIAATAPPASTAINYRIIPQPRVLNGEQTLSLPTNIAISFETPNGSPLSLNLPPSHVVIVNGVPTTVFDILFAPSGAVVGQGTGTGQIILWVRNISQPITPADLTVGKGTLIAIQPRTGFIVAQPVASNAAPYSFTTDGRSSGL